MASRLLMIIAVAMLGACDVNLEKVMDAVDGRARQVVVLAPQPVVLTEKPTVFNPATPLKVVGEWTSLCLVLKDGIPLQPQMDRIFSDALGGSKVTVNVVFADGTRTTLHEPMQAWSRWGRVLPRDELSGCASASCGTRLPVGAAVKSVEVSAAPNLAVRGVYWRSEQGVDEKPQATSTAKTSNANQQSKCGGS